MKFPVLTLALVASTGRAFSPTLATTSVLATSSSSGSSPTATTANRPNSSTPKRMISSILDLLGGGGGGSFDKSQLIAPEKALKGRAQKMPNIDGLKHYVLGNKIDHVPEGHQVAVFANGVSFVVDDIDERRSLSLSV